MKSLKQFLQEQLQITESSQKHSGKFSKLFIDAMYEHQSKDLQNLMPDSSNENNARSWSDVLNEDNMSDSDENGYYISVYDLSSGRDYYNDEAVSFINKIWNEEAEAEFDRNDRYFNADIYDPAKKKFKITIE